MLSRRQFFRGAGIAIVVAEVAARGRPAVAQTPFVRSEGTSEVAFYSAAHAQQRSWALTRTLRRAAGAGASRLTLTFDPRVLASSSSIVVVSGTGRSSRIEPTSVEETAREVVARYDLSPSGAEEVLLVLPLGGFPTFPNDCLDDALLPTAMFDGTGQTVLLAVETVRVGVNPWGAPVSAAWEPVTGQPGGPLVPAFVRLQSTGPAATPAGLEVIIVTDALTSGDPTLASTSGLDGAETEDVSVTSEVTGELRRTTLRVKSELAADDERVIGLAWTAAGPATASESAPIARVSVSSMGTADRPRRQTGSESIAAPVEEIGF